MFVSAVAYSNGASLSIKCMKFTRGNARLTVWPSYIQHLYAKYSSGRVMCVCVWGGGSGVSRGFFGCPDPPPPTVLSITYDNMEI